MRIPPIILALIAALVLGIAGKLRAAGQYVSVDYPASTVEGELQIGVTYTIWVPDGVKILRGVIVHQHGAGTPASKAGATAAYDLHWQALAKKWDCALLGPSYHVLNEGTEIGSGEAELWYDPRRGSDKGPEARTISLATFSSARTLAILTTSICDSFMMRGSSVWLCSLQVFHNCFLDVGAHTAVALKSAPPMLLFSWPRFSPSLQSC